MLTRLRLVALTRRLADGEGCSGSALTRVRVDCGHRFSRQHESLGAPPSAFRGARDGRVKNYARYPGGTNRRSRRHLASMWAM